MKTRAGLGIIGGAARYATSLKKSRVCNRFQFHHCSSIGSVKFMANRLLLLVLIHLRPGRREFDLRRKSSMIAERVQARSILSIFAKHTKGLVKGFYSAVRYSGSEGEDVAYLSPTPRSYGH